MSASDSHFSIFKPYFSTMRRSRDYGDLQSFILVALLCIYFDLHLETDRLLLAWQQRTCIYVSQISRPVQLQNNTGWIINLKARNITTS